MPSAKPVASLRFLGGLAFLFAVLPGVAQASLGLRISETSNESVHVEVIEPGTEPGCAIKDAKSFGPKANIGKVTETLYIQKLNSEVGEEAHYLKAARMGGGIYVHLPYFIPPGACQNVAFEIRAKHVLWAGKWHVGSVTIPAGRAWDKSVFFTNEDKPVIKGATYFDAGIPEPTRARLDADFTKVIGYFERTLKIKAMQDIGAVVAVVRNEGNYTGFGGDSLNIIRMSVDNPTPQTLERLDQIFPPTFAHELSHKLQDGKLFALPLARHIVEGSADFFKVLVLHSAGMIGQVQAKSRIMDAAANCTKFADGRTLVEKNAQQAFNYREPYDCGMVYYMTSYYTSGMPVADFVATLRIALSGDQNYSANRDSLCLLYEATCKNERLKALAGNRERVLPQIAWLDSQLIHPPVLP